MNDTKNAYIAVVGIKNSTLHSADAILCKVLCDECCLKQCDIILREE